MKRSDWLTNKKREIPPRPTRLFNLTDEIIERILKAHKADSMELPWPDGNTVIEFLESIPEFINSKSVTVIDNIKWAQPVAPIVSLWVMKSGESGCSISATIQTSAMMQVTHQFTANKNNLGLFVLTSSISYPLVVPMNPSPPMIGAPVPWPGDGGYVTDTHSSYTISTSSDSVNIYTIGAGGSGGGGETQGSQAIGTGSQAIGRQSHWEGTSSWAEGPSSQAINTVTWHDGIQGTVDGRDHALLG